MGNRSQVETRTVKISECKPILRRAVAKRRPVFVWGPPGVGKSDMVNQVASEFPNSTVITCVWPLWILPTLKVSLTTVKATIP